MHKFIIRSQEADNLEIIYEPELFGFISESRGRRKEREMPMTTVYSHRLRRRGQREGRGVDREKGSRRMVEEERRECQSPSGIRHEAEGRKKRGIRNEEVEQPQHPRRCSERKEPDAVG